MKKICVVTSTRAEYGLLKNVISYIQKDEVLDLNLIVTGTHLSTEFGMTISEIEEDGFPIADKVDILMNGDSCQAVCKTIGVAFISFADVLAKINPDMLIVLGDRYELLAICGCAVNLRIPISHISGGETTEGAVDDCIRHCITKMSYLHFPGCEAYRRRIIQLGESPDRVFNFGDVGVENVNKCKLLTRDELEQELKLTLQAQYMSVTFHPVTLEANNVEEQIEQLLKAISHFPDIQFIFSKANADAGGRIINKMIDKFVIDHTNCAAYHSLGLKRYLSLLKYSCGVIGNSSSGIVEAPSFQIPTINIGDRQKGRLQAASIINSQPECNALISAIEKALDKKFKSKTKSVINPYGQGDTAINIVNTIKDQLFNKIDLKKAFYDLPESR